MKNLIKCYCGHTTTCDCIDTLELGQITKEPKKVGEYQQELFSYLHDLGVTALQSEMQEIERIVLNMQQEQDKNKYSEEDLDMLRKFMIQEQNFSKSCLDVFIEQFKKK